MTLAYACVAPHGEELIPQLAPRSLRRIFSKTREGMRALARDIVSAKLDTIIIASPHNLRLLGEICVVISENSTGTVHFSARRQVTLKVACDAKFAKQLLQSSIESGLAAVGANYGTFKGPSSDLPMDWGTLVPPWFVMKEKHVNARVVIVAPPGRYPCKRMSHSEE